MRVWDISKSALAKCGNVSGVGGVEDVVRTAAASFKESMSRGKQQQFRNTERESVTSAGLRDRSPPRRESRFPPPSREGTFVSPGRRDRDSKFSRDGSKTGSISTGRDSICGTTATAQKMTDLSTQFEESRESVIITTKTVVTSEPNDTHKLSHSSSDGASRSPCLLRVLHGHAGGVRSLDFQGSLLFTGDIHGCVRAWHVERYAFTFFTMHQWLNALT